MPPPLAATVLLFLRNADIFASRCMYKAMMATIDAGLRGDRTQPTDALSCVQDMVHSGYHEEMGINPLGYSLISQNMVLRTVSNVSRKRPQVANYTKKPNDVSLCGSSVMYVPHLLPWSSYRDANIKSALKKLNVTYYGRSPMDGVIAKCNFYHTFWGLPDPLEVKAFEQRIILITALDLSMKSPQPAKYTKKPNDVALCGRSVIYVPYLFPWSSSGDVNRIGASNESNVAYYGKSDMDGVIIDCNFYHTFWSLPDPLEVKAFKQAKKGSPGVYSAMSTGQSTTPSGRALVPAKNGTATGSGSSISVKSSKRATNTLGSGDDDPNDEGQKSLEASDPRPLVPRVQITRLEQLDNLNPMDVILILDNSLPAEERSQIIRAGQARNFQFHKNRSYYEAVYELGQEDQEEQDADYSPSNSDGLEENNDDWLQFPYFFEENIAESLDLPANEEEAPEEDDQAILPAAEAEPADLPPEEGMEPDDGEALDNEPDYSPSDSDGLEEDNDGWLQFPYFFEENIAESLDLPANEEEEAPEEDDQEILPAAEAEPADLPSEEGMEPDDGEALDNEPDYSPSDSDGLEEDNDEWLQFPDFFEENAVENLDLPAILASEEEEAPEEGSDHDDEDMEQIHDADYLPDYDGSDDSEDSWLQFPYFFEEDVVQNLDLPAIVAESDEDGNALMINEEEEDSSDTDYAATEEEDLNADEAEWLSNIDFMDDLYTESSDSDDVGEDPDYYPSSGSDDTE